MITISTISDLRDLKNQKTFYNGETILFASNHNLNLSSEEVNAVQEKLNSYKNECGCKTGAKWTLYSFVIFPIIYFLTHLIIPFGIITWVSIFIVFIFLSALIGKLYSLKMAKYKFEKEISKLIENLE